MSLQTLKSEIKEMQDDCCSFYGAVSKMKRESGREATIELVLQILKMPAANRNIAAEIVDKCDTILAEWEERSKIVEKDWKKIDNQLQ